MGWFGGHFTDNNKLSDPYDKIYTCHDVEYGLELWGDGVCFENREESPYIHTYVIHFWPKKGSILHKKWKYFVGGHTFQRAAYTEEEAHNLAQDIILERILKDDLLFSFSYWKKDIEGNDVCGNEIEPVTRREYNDNNMDR